MALGLAIFLLLVAVYFGWRVRNYIALGGFWFPRRWRVTRAKEPITFWAFVVAYGTLAAVAGLAGIAGVIRAFLGRQQIPY